VVLNGAYRQYSDHRASLASRLNPTLNGRSALRRMVGSAEKMVYRGGCGSGLDMSAHPLL
jgi:hypothetical protein